MWEQRVRFWKIYLRSGPSKWQKRALCQILSSGTKAFVFFSDMTYNSHVSMHTRYKHYRVASNAHKIYIAH